MRHNTLRYVNVEEVWTHAHIIGEYGVLRRRVIGRVYGISAHSQKLKLIARRCTVLA